MNKTRKTIWFVLSICFICMIFTMPVSAKGKSVTKKNVPKKIVLNRTELLLYPGEERKLRVEYIKPEKASAKVVWKSKRKAVAAISPKGELKARKQGKTTITAISKKNPKVKAVVKVTVKKRPEKKEKECVFKAKRHAYNSSDKWLDVYANINHLEPVIFRNKEDILEYVRCARIFHVKNNKGYDTYDEVIKMNKREWYKETSGTFFKAYLNMDFEKESLLVFFSRCLTISSLETKFDANGKLRGIIGFQTIRTRNRGIGLGVTAIDTVALKISKQDEAMIDYYQFQEVEEDPEKQ
ncbi:MAG: Ig-like domain-containing protein [Lachnospiraceae bacterium]|nr:Ig-like domain-containing protein [Lachnospiraceae bacterium]